MRILCTGAGGFIGSHVCAALKGAGHHVIGLDTTIVAERPVIYDDFIVADITHPLSKIPDLDAVIHLAAIAAPRDCDSDPARAYAVNVNGTSQVLRMALASGAKKVVFSSSAHVYDIPPRYLPTDETHPLRLNNTYTTTKILGEKLCELYFENHGLSYTTLRLYNAYGIGQAKGYFLPEMISKAEQGDITLNGGDTTKDFVWVEDVARAFVLAVESHFVGAINIGTGVQTPLWKIARSIANAYGVSLETHSAGHPSHMQAEIGRAKRVLGWQPITSLEEGLNAVLSDAKVKSIR